MRLIYVLLAGLVMATVAAAGLLPEKGAQPARPPQPQALQAQAQQAQSPRPAPPAQTPGRKYMDEAAVEHKPGVATVKADDPRPLMQAVAALNEEYGWLVDYEDPPYASNSELVDASNPQWLATHPDAPHNMIPAGRPFQSDYDEGPAITTPAGQWAALRKIIAQYNRSGNPGKFTVREGGGGRYVVVGSSVKNQSGQDRNVAPILDTRISIPVQQRSTVETLKLILKEVSAKTGTEVIIGSAPLNLVFRTQVTVGGDNVSARELLVQALDGTGQPLVYNLMYFASTGRYIMNVSGTAQALHDTYGRKTLIPSGRRPN